MSSDANIRPGAMVIDGVSRRFRIVHDRSATLKETVVRRKRASFTELWALRDVSASIKPGESVGIVGRNGSGKSTLLKLLAGIIPPHTGQVRTGGSLAAMLELGSGFHPDFTGRENVYMNAAIHGIPDRTVDEQLDAIIDFAELRDFIDMPVRTYSSGMAMRLAFSVSSHINPDILLLDEVLAVGDEAFQRKCMGRIHDFKRGGGTLVFVSHDPAVVERVCDRAILLEGGEIVFDGPPDEILSRYHRLLADEESGLGAHLERPDGGQEDAVYDPDAIPASDVVHLDRVRLLRDGIEVPNAVCGDSVSVEVTLRSSHPVDDPVVGLSLALETGLALNAVSTRHAPPESNVSSDLADALASPGKPVTIALEISNLPLQEGRIDVYVGVGSMDESRHFMGGRRVMSFSVFARDAASGLVAMDTRWRTSS